MADKERLRRILDAWKEGCASLDEIRDLAADLGNAHYAHGIPALLELLDNGDEIVRYNAINSLGFEFNHKGAIGKLILLLQADPDADCRDAAAGALGNICQNSGDTRVMSALARAARGDQDEGVRRGAYKALIIVNGVSRDEHLRLVKTMSLKVDKNHIQEMLARARHK